MKITQLKQIILNSRGLIGIFTIISLLLWTGYSAYQPTSPLQINEVNNASGTVDLSLTPANITIKPNTEHDLTLNITSSLGKVTATAIELSYDPSKLEVISVTQGDFLSNTMVAPTILDGKVKFTYISTIESGGVEGSGTLATIKIKSKDTDARLSFTTQNQVSIVVDGHYQDTNALHTASDSIITIDTTDDDTDDTTDDEITYTIPSLRSASDPTCTNLSLAWDKAENAPGYYLDLANNTNFTNVSSSDRLSESITSYTFTGLTENTKYYARIALADIPDFPQFSPIIELSTKDCSNTDPEDTNSTPTPTPTPTPTSTPTPPASQSPVAPSPTSSAIALATADPTSAPTSQLTSPSPKSLFSGTLNDIFGQKPQSSESKDDTSPSFFRKIFLGWQAIFYKLFNI